MDFTATNLSYNETGYISDIISDYLAHAESLRSYYQHPVSIQGIRSAISARRKFPTDRQSLGSALRRQYQGPGIKPAVSANLDLLSRENCFTITTAHQPAIFTGSLYFIYKILHVIKLAEELSRAMPEEHFVPVYFMGSEDADLEELGKIFLDHEELTWETGQTGAVGRMQPKGLEKLVARIEGEYAVKPFGKELIGLIRSCYLETDNIQTATFKLVDELFGRYGLLVLIPDQPELKRQMVPIFEDDLLRQIPFALVSSTTEGLSARYKVQANPREINLFYLKDDLRGRIERINGEYFVHESKLRYLENQIKDELHQHPERFSPNVILRGLFQETILPNIAFVGGGGELAYWLEFKKLFEQYHVPYPTLVLRNSFLIIEKKWQEKLVKTGMSLPELFRPAEELFSEIVKKESQSQLDLAKEIGDAHHYYEHVKKISASVDPSLSQHVEALQAKALKPLRELEKKLLKAEKRKFEEQQKLVYAIKSALFPWNNLQERIDNFMPYYAEWGSAFCEAVYQKSLSLEQKFVVLQEL
jgi:bacillithiol biosynthesis cysteine-adding enzyme BshC